MLKYNIFGKMTAFEKFDNFGLDLMENRVYVGPMLVL
jgi:hypothetical protein